MRRSGRKQIAWVECWDKRRTATRSRWDAGAAQASKVENAGDPGVDRLELWVYQHFDKPKG